MTTTDRVAELDTQALLELTEPMPGALAALHRRLEIAADREGVLDVAYATMDTPVGSLLLATTTSGLVRVAYQREGHDRVLETLAVKISPRILRAPGRLDEAMRQFDEYFAGRRTAFDLPLNHALARGFRRVVQQHLSEIPYGHTQSYKDVARIVGNPGAVRAVGTACATNPLPIVVPCHRVLRTDGTLGGYAGGLDAKAALLSLENAA